MASVDIGQTRDAFIVICIVRFAASAAAAIGMY